MSITGISHIAIGVTDPERSIAFYRDLLGMTVSMEAIEEGPGVRRRAIYLRWNNQSRPGFIVLDYHLNRPPHGQPLNFFDVGVHHFAFTVDDVQAIYERAKTSGVEITREPITRIGRLWGVPGDENPAVITLIVKDPDGNYIQFDQYFSERM